MKYDVLTWDCELGRFTEQAGMENPTRNIDIHVVRRALKELRQRGYSCHRCGNPNRVRESDAFVLVERIDNAKTD